MQFKNRKEKARKWKVKAHWLRSDKNKEREEKIQGKAESAAYLQEILAAVEKTCTRLSSACLAG